MARKSTLFSAFCALALTACTSATEPVAEREEEPGWPTTRPLETSIAPVPAPLLRDLRSMSVESLRDGTVSDFEIRRFGNGIRVRESSGCTWTRIHDWFAPSDSYADCGSSTNWRTATATVAREGNLFPLQVGSTVRYTRRAVSSTGKRSTRETTCAVESADLVIRQGQPDTPAYKVVCSDGRIERITWFSPEIGPVAYREAHLKKGLREAWIRRD